jgi:hypothetical protein
MKEAPMGFQIGLTALARQIGTFVPTTLRGLREIEIPGAIAAGAVGGVDLLRMQLELARKQADQLASLYGATSEYGKATFQIAMGMNVLPGLSHETILKLMQGNLSVSESNKILEKQLELMRQSSPGAQFKLAQDSANTLLRIEDKLKQLVERGTISAASDVMGVVLQAVGLALTLYPPTRISGLLARIPLLGRLFGGGGGGAASRIIPPGPTILTLPGVPGPLAQFQEGGYVARPMLARVGEVPEWIIPESKIPRISRETYFYNEREPRITQQVTEFKIPRISRETYFYNERESRATQQVTERQVNIQRPLTINIEIDKISGKIGKEEFENIYEDFKNRFEQELEIRGILEG